MLPPPTERQARVIWLALTGLAFAVLAALVAGLVWGLGRALSILSPVLWPLAVAGVVAYLLDPVVDFLQRHGLKRPRAILAVFALALVLVAGFFASIVPPLVRETRQLVAGIPGAATRIEHQLESWVNRPPPWFRKLVGPRGESGKPEGAGQGEASPQATPASTAGTNAPPSESAALPPKTLETATDALTRALPVIGRWLFGQVGKVASWFGVLAGLALIPVYSYYFLVEKEGISSKWTHYLPVADSRFKRELVFVLDAINNYLIAFFRGQVLVAMADGVLYGLGFLLAGLEYALLLGVMAVFLTMIPFLGAIILCVSALIVAAVQFGDWLHPILVLVVFACVQMLESLVISPKIMGGRVGLHPLTIIVAVMVGTALLGGLLGGILAIPLTAALRVVMFRYVWKPDSEPPPR